MTNDKQGLDLNATQAFLSDESQWPTVQIELNDVQPLWGGSHILVEGNRHVVVRIVERGLQERRYEFEISDSAWRQLLDALIGHDFVTIHPADRPGIPDEARPTITLTNANGEQHSVAKWAGAKDPRFDAIYGAILSLITYTAQLKPSGRGPYRFNV